jgi:protein disulfide-isomerase A1
VDAFKEKNRLALVAYFEGDKESSEQIAALYTVADNLRDSLSVGLVQSSDNKVVLFRQFDAPEVAFEGDVSVESLTEFVNAERFPLIDEIGPENFRDYQARGLPLVWIAVDGTDQEQVDSTIATLKPFAGEFKGKLSFTYVDNGKYAQHVTGLGITKVPGLLIMGDGNKKFLYDSELDNAAGLKAFFDGYADGTLQPFLKSEPAPESNDEPVKVVVGSTFNDFVGSDKDVFLEFYAPWCGHCKKLAPEYEKVGAAFANVDKVVIAKIDATENDTPEEIKGFPTLMFYPAGSTKGEKYGGGRNAEDIVSWIEEHATVDVASISKEEL